MTSGSSRVGANCVWASGMAWDLLQLSLLISAHQNLNRYQFFGSWTEVDDAASKSCCLEPYLARLSFAGFLFETLRESLETSCADLK